MSEANEARGRLKQLVMVEYAHLQSENMRLLEENERLRELLHPFLEQHEWLLEHATYDDPMYKLTSSITWGWLLAVRTALEQHTPGQDLSADEEKDLGDGGLGSGKWLEERDAQRT